MNTLKRREEVLKTLRSSERPVTGTDMAKLMKVSRQVIVQDIAVLRAQGVDIMATSNGYSIENKKESHGNVKTLVCKHEGYDAIKDELATIVDMGGRILDVIIDHPVYGEIRCPLMINSRYDLDIFLDKVRQNKAEPLSTLTGGEHIHTIEVPSDEIYEMIMQKLKNKGIIVGD